MALSVVSSLFTSLLPSGPIIAPPTGEPRPSMATATIRSAVTTAAEAGFAALDAPETRRRLGTAGGAIATRTLTRTLGSNIVKRHIRVLLRTAATDGAEAAAHAIESPQLRARLAQSAKSVGTQAIRKILRAETLRNNIDRVIAQAVGSGSAHATAAFSDVAFQASLTTSAATVGAAALATPAFQAQVRVATEDAIDAAMQRATFALASQPFQTQIETSTNRAIDIAVDRAIEGLTSAPFIDASTTTLTAAFERSLRDLNQSAHPTLVETSDTLESLYLALRGTDRKGLIQALQASIQAIDSLRQEPVETLNEIFLARQADNSYTRIPEDQREILIAQMQTMSTTLSGYLAILNGNDDTYRTQDELTQTRNTIVTSLVDTRQIYLDLKRRALFPDAPAGILVRLLKYRSVQEGALTSTILKTRETAAGIFSSFSWFRKKPASDNIDLPHYQNLGNGQTRWNNLSWFTMIALTIKGIGASIIALPNRVLRAVHLQ
jgi:hypothetical protein